MSNVCAYTGQLLSVETYGIPTVPASAALLRYCSQWWTKAVCNEQAARRYLQPIVGDRIWQKYLDSETGQPRYAMSVGLVMVNRVYLTRSISQVRRIGNAQGGGAALEVVPPGVAVAGAHTEAAAAQQTPASRAGTDADALLAMQGRLDELTKELGTLKGGGAVSLQLAAGNEVVLNQTFSRPVAIGYRSIRYEPAADQSAN